MTEQAFREALKASVGNTGLSLDRQQQVLAKLRKEDKTVRMSGKMRIALAMAVVLLLGTTGAVAAGSGFVDWNGEPIPASGGTTPPYMQGLYEHHQEPENGQIITLESIKPPEGSNSLGIGSRRDNSDVYASSVEEMQAWVEAEIDEFLPWPVNLPKEYNQLKKGWVHYAVDTYGEYTMLHQEVTEDGLFVRSYFELPDDHLYMDSYTLRLLNAEGQELRIDVYLSAMNYRNHFQADEESRTTVLDVEDFEQVVAIESPVETLVALRDEFTTYDIRYKEVWGYPDGVKRESTQNYDCLVIEITGQGTPEELLSIFGLTAK